MAEVIYTRKNTDTEANNTQIEDGQLIYTKQGHVFMDFGTDRIPMQNTPDNTMSDISTNSVSNNVIKSYVDNKVLELNNKIDKKIVWTNSDLSTNFSGQSIHLSESLSNYGAYEILFIQSTSVNSRVLTTGKIPVGYGTILNMIAGNNYYRATSLVVDGTSITFEDCHYLVNGSANIDNSYIIPFLVIAHKTNLFDGV